VITQQPQSVSVKAGSSAVFSVVVANETGVTYQWSRNGVSIQGGTGKSLAIAPAQPANAGTYRVSVTNTGGVTSSAGAVLSIVNPVAAPVITQQPRSVSVQAGSSAAFSVAVANESGVTYQWFRNGARITGGTGKSLAIAPALPANAGTYRVSITNPGGVASSADAVLSIVNAVAAPVITQQPKSVSVKAGSAASFSVALSNEAGVSYQWFRNGASVAGATSKSYSIVAARVTDAGLYSLSATNAGGTAKSANVVLQILPVDHQQAAAGNSDKSGNAAKMVSTYSVVVGSFSWEEARVDAEKKGGHLATVGSLEEWNKIKEALKGFTFGNYGNSTGGIWLGATDSKKAGSWEWIDGTPWSFDDWATEEPNYFGVERFLEIAPNFKWNNQSIKRCYLLEIEQSASN
jgi:hypothetical protein